MNSRYFPRNRIHVALGFMTSLISTLIGFGIVIPKRAQLGVVFTVIVGLLMVYYGLALLLKEKVSNDPPEPPSPPAPPSGQPPRQT